MARSQLTRDTIEKIIAAQATRTQRLAVADAVIVNDGIGLETLRQRVDNLPLHP